MSTLYFQAIPLMYGQNRRIFPVCKKEIIKLAAYNYNPMNSFVRISPTGLQFIKSHFVAKKNAICCCICLEYSLQNHSFPFM